MRRSEVPINVIGGAIVLAMPIFFVMLPFIAISLMIVAGGKLPQ